MPSAYRNGFAWFWIRCRERRSKPPERPCFPLAFEEKCFEKSYRFRGRFFRGFTLVELLVALALLSVITVIMFGVLTGVSSSWQEGQARIESQKGARSIFDAMSRELVGARLPNDRTNTSDLQFVVNPTPVSATFLNPQALFWQAPSAAGGTNGNLAEFGYFVRWDTTNASNPRAMLCRFFLMPDSADYLIYSDPSNWVNDAMLEKIAPGVADSALPSNSYKGWFADNVIALWVRCLDPNGKPIDQDIGGSSMGYAFDSRKGYRYASGSGFNLHHGYVANGNTYPLATLPSSVEIALVILDSRAAARLAVQPTYPTSTPATFWTDIDTFMTNLPAPVRAGARLYTTRVALQNAD